MRETNKTLAAVAVFRELYDQDKDIYDVLAEYVKEIILNEKLKSFTRAEITKKLNEKYSFKISESVIKTALKRLRIPRVDGKYTAQYDFEVGKGTDIYYQQLQQNQVLLDNLYNYIENETEKSLSESEKEEINHQFLNYVMNEEISEEYSLLISKYIMSVSLNMNYMNIINRIKEGTLIYEGICYSGDLNSLGNWTSNLNIYLEQEVLFYIAGYNGEVHKDIYCEMIKYIFEINSKHPLKKRYINLWYSEDVKEEIEAYFSKAEKIFQKGDVIDPSKKPMLFILDGVRTKSDIVQKKSRFYSTIEQYGIKLFKFDYYNEENRKYSIVSQEMYGLHRQLNPDKEESYVQRCTDKLNYIEILRKHNNIGLDNVEHTLLTANSTILKCAYSEKMYNKGEVPKATDIDFMINRFWFKLNKGFGKGSTPKTINIVSRARIVLSFLANDKVSQIYDDIKKKYKDGDISKEEVTGFIATLRSYSKTPDEIMSETIGEEIEGLKDFDINKKIEEMKRKELERQADKQKIEYLEKELQVIKSEKENQKIKNDEEIQQLKKKIEQSENDKQELEKKVEKIITENQEKKREEEERRAKNKQRNSLLIRISMLIIFLVAIFCVLIYVFNVEKSISGIASIILTVIFGIPALKNFIVKNEREK